MASTPGRFATPTGAAPLVGRGVGPDHEVQVWREILGEEGGRCSAGRQDAELRTGPGGGPHPGALRLEAEGDLSRIVRRHRRQIDEDEIGLRDDILGQRRRRQAGYHEARLSAAGRDGGEGRRARSLLRRAGTRTMTGTPSRRAGNIAAWPGVISSARQAPQTGSCASANPVAITRPSIARPRTLTTATERRSGDGV